MTLLTRAPKQLNSAKLSCEYHRRRNDFQSGGRQIFGSREWRVSAGRRACAKQGVSEGDVPPLRSWSFFENVGSNEAIWCTILHHIKHWTACLLRFLFFFFFFFYFRTGWSKKWRGHAPSLKSGGATGPLPPFRFRRLWRIRKNTYNRENRTRQKQYLPVHIYRPLYNWNDDTFITSNTETVHNTGRFTSNTDLSIIIITTFL